MVSQEVRDLRIAIGSYVQERYEPPRREVGWHYFGHGAKESLLSSVYLDCFPEDTHCDGGVTKEDVAIGFFLHDAGKLTSTTEPSTWRVSRAQLTEQEWVEIRSHVHHSLKFLEACEGLLSNKFNPVVKSIALEHHEYFNGNGGPQKLKGEEISYFGRLACVVDHFISLCEDRPERRNTIHPRRRFWYNKSYRRAAKMLSLTSRHSPHQALAIMRNDRGSIFDPSIFDKFSQVIENNLYMAEPGLRWIGEYDPFQ